VYANLVCVEVVHMFERPEMKAKHWSCKCGINVTYSLQGSLQFWCNSL